MPRVAKQLKGRTSSPTKSTTRKTIRRGRPKGPSRKCAIIGCARENRSKGYCSAHYQKFRMLARTKRLPRLWKEYAPPQTVKDIMLPRGRAASAQLRTALTKGKLREAAKRSVRKVPKVPIPAGGRARAEKVLEQ